MTKNEPLQSCRLIFKALGIGFFLFASAFFCQPVFAADLIDQYNLWTDGHGYNNIAGQVFTADKNNISGVGLHYSWFNGADSATASTTLFICKYEADGFFPKDCYNEGPNFLYREDYSAYPLVNLRCGWAGGDCSSEAAFTRWFFHPIPLEIGQKYLFAFIGQVLNKPANFYHWKDNYIPLGNWGIYSSNDSDDGKIGVGSADAVFLTYYDPDYISILPGSLGAVGVSVAPNWFCCEGSCGYPISMLPQGGWWGIGSTTAREIKWWLDNSTTTDSIDFTNHSNFLLQIPTSTPLSYHVLHIETYFGGNLVATGSVQIQIVAAADCINTSPDQFNSFCEIPCAGLATSTDPLNLANFICGLREFGCWLVVPTPASISYVMGQFNGLTAKFPLAPFTKLYDDLNLAATGTQAVAPGNFEIPFWSTSSQQYIGTSFDLGSSTLSHSYAWTKFRRLEVIGGWCVGIMPIILILIKLIV